MQHLSRARFMSLLAIGVSLLLSRTLFGKSKIDGDWEGSLDKGKYLIVLHIRLGGSCTVDIPTQAIRGMPANVLFDESDKFLRVDMPGGGAVYEGSLKGSELVGTFGQAGSKSPLTFKRRKKS